MCTLCICTGKKRLFIVAVSANSDPEIAQGAIDAGFDGFIEKPFTIKSLQKVILCCLFYVLLALLWGGRTEKELYEALLLRMFGCTLPF